MTKYFVLYNPNAGNGQSTENTKKLSSIISDAELQFIDMTTISDYSEIFSNVKQDEAIIISGGDGTLNRFINDTLNIDINCDIYYFATGSGNDFMRDVAPDNAEKPFLINKYLENLPIVNVNGKDYKFLNGVGFGIDGYCCRVGDEQKEKSDKPVNYTSIAIKGLLFHYKPQKCTVTVDGVAHEFENAWLAPTMNGRLYGGGMIPTPNQKRFDDDKKLSVMVMHKKSKIKTLMVFPSIFEGKHIEHEDMVSVFEGKEITVEYESPTDLQIDGETIVGVKKCTCTVAPKTAKETATV